MVTAFVPPEQYRIECLRRRGRGWHTDASGLGPLAPMLKEAGYYYDRRENEWLSPDPKLYECIEQLRHWVNMLAVPGATTSATKAPPVEPRSDTPASRLATEFYRLWEGRSRTPTAADLRTAEGLVEEYGDDAPAILSRVVQVLRKEWPAASTFGSVTKYWVSAAAEYLAGKRKTDRREQFVSKWSAAWSELPAEQQAEIEAVVKHDTRNLSEPLTPEVFRWQCVQRLAKQHGEFPN